MYYFENKFSCLTVICLPYCLGHPDDEQMDCVAKIPPVVAMFAGHPDLLNYVEQVIRMTEDNDFAVVIGLAAARYYRFLAQHSRHHLSVFRFFF